MTLARLFRSNYICPIDKEEVEIQNGELFFNDNHARREVLQLQSYCPNKKNGCDWKGALGDMEVRINSIISSSLTLTSGARHAYIDRPFYKEKINISLFLFSTVGSQNRNLFAIV